MSWRTSAVCIECVVSCRLHAFSNSAQRYFSLTSVQSARTATAACAVRNISCFDASMVRLRELSPEHRLGHTTDKVSGLTMQHSDTLEILTESHE